MIDALLATTPIEAAAVALGLVYVVLAAAGSRWCWPAGGASAALLVFVSWQGRLPMQALLQGFYVAISVQGWLRWSSPETARVGFWPWHRHAVAIAAMLVASVFGTLLLKSRLESAAPFIDVSTTLFSLLATWLTTRMRIENWVYWIAIDSVLAWLF
ncbi:nicotinamide riboside transporter PnuC, partial [bacterium]